jgi:site-specific DNA-methyltransferase (adenine-specific)
MSDATRRRPGEIRDAIISFFQTHQREATPAEIRIAVADFLKSQIPESSVRSYLRLNTPGQFLQPSPGKYQLKNQSNENGQKPTRMPSKISGDADYGFGDASLWNADCMDWLDAQSDRSLQAVVTDPPYGLLEYSDEQQRKLRNGKGGVWRHAPSFDGHQRAPLPRFTVLDESHLLELHSFFNAWARRCYRVLVPGAHLVVATNPLLSHRLAIAIGEAGFERRGEIIRLVMTMRGGDRPKNAHEEFPEISAMPRSMFEPWLLFRKPLEGRLQDNLRKWKTGGLRRPEVNRPFGDVIESSPTRKAEREIANHPSLKPQSFIRQIVRAVLPLGEGTILDCFAGSGSTLAAAEAVGYRSVGVERDREYFEMATKAIPRLAALSVGGVGVVDAVDPVLPQFRDAFAVKGGRPRA